MSKVDRSDKLKPKPPAEKKSSPKRPAKAAARELARAKAQEPRSFTSGFERGAEQRAATLTRPTLARGGSLDSFSLQRPASTVQKTSIQLSATAAAAGAPSGEGGNPPAETLRVNAPAMLNMRKGPDLDAEIDRRLEDGTLLEVTPPPGGGSPYNGEWVHVKDPSGNEGWVSTRFVGPADAPSAPQADAPVQAVAPTQAAAPVQGSQPITREGPLALGHHLSPDLIVRDWPVNEAEIRAEIARVAEAGGHSAVLIIRTDSDAQAFKVALDEAANRGLKLELRVDFAHQQSTPIHIGPDGQFTYNREEGATFAQGLIEQLAGLDARQMSAIGSIQLGNEPLDPKEHTEFLGRKFADIAPGTDINAEYVALVAAAGTTPGQVARSMGLAVRDMYLDIGQQLVNRFGEGLKTQLATPAMGAGWAAYNDVGAQREFFLGVMGLEANGTWGRSAFEYAAQAGQHAYMDPNAMAIGAYPSSTQGYEEAVRIATQAGRTDFGRPVFTEVGLGNGSPESLEAFMKHVVDVWNAAHPDKTVASAAIWGSHPRYVHEPMWEMKDIHVVKQAIDGYHAAYANQ